MSRLWPWRDGAGRWVPGTWSLRAVHLGPVAHLAPWSVESHGGEAAGSFLGASGPPLLSARRVVREGVRWGTAVGGLLPDVAGPPQQLAWLLLGPGPPWLPDLGFGLRAAFLPFSARLSAHFKGVLEVSIQGCQVRGSGWKTICCQARPQPAPCSLWTTPTPSLPSPLPATLLHSREAVGLQGADGHRPRAVRG